VLNKQPKTIKRARNLRRKMTLPEVLLWRELRKRPAGLKFRRQHPAGPFVLDFYCAEARLCVEVDGLAHDRSARSARDAQRDALFAGQGIATLRMPARDVLANLEECIAHIAEAARSRLPLHHPPFGKLRTGGPPPQDELGED